MANKTLATIATTSTAASLLAGDRFYMVRGGVDFMTPGSVFIAATSAAITAAIAGKEPSLGNPSTNGYVLSSTTAGVRSWIAPGGGATWGEITGTPTTLGGYGITDAQPLDSDLTAIAALTTTAFGRSLLTQANANAAVGALGLSDVAVSGSFEDLSAKPTTIAGYGIIDSRLYAEITPQMHGALADGTGLTITAPDIAAHPEWRGTYAVGDTWDFVGIQEAIYAAFGGPLLDGTDTGWHNSAKSYLNKRLFLPNGRYIINQTLELVGVTGFHITGAGRRSTFIYQSGINKPHMFFDGVSYGKMEHIAFDQLGASTQAQVELDWTGDFATLKPQQITIADCSFHGEFIAAIGLRVAKSGGAAQGDTILLTNCFINSFTQSGVQTGTADAFAYNALSIMVQGGNIQSCPKFGILSYGGSIFVDGTSFQPVYIKQQVDNNGCDFAVMVANNGSSMREIRSESLKLSHGVFYLDKCWVESALADWSASTAVTAGVSIFSGSDGRVFLCVQSGITGVAEPTWSNFPSSGSEANNANQARSGLPCSMGAGTTTITSADFRPTVGRTIVVPFAGAGGGDLITTVVSVDPSFTSAVLAHPSVGAVTDVYPHIGVLIDDGTAKHIAFDYNTVEGARKVSHCVLPYGKITPASGGDVNFNRFTRADWLGTRTLAELGEEVISFNTNSAGSVVDNGIAIAKLQLFPAVLPAAGAINNGKLWNDGAHIYAGIANAWQQLDGAAGEPSLGNPSTNGYLLSSTTAGVRSWVAPGAGSGDFVGPASATDNAVVLFDGTTGKLGKNSTVIINAGDMSGVASISLSSTVSNAISLIGDSASRISYYAQNINSAGNASFYFENNRGSFAAYGGLLTGGSAHAGTFFGLTRADRTFLISDGDNSAGLAIGTLTDDPLVLGHNNVEQVRVLSGGTVFAGDIESSDSAKGLILKSPDSTRWRVKVDNTGALTTTSL